MIFIYRKYIKRIFDFIFALMLLIISLPIMVIVSVIIPLESKGGIFFKQERPGLHGKIFIIYKFRTMIVNSDKSATDMQRTTKIGRFIRKTSVDELPQLFNILAGQMSFIGPRPLLTEYLDYYTEEQSHRHDVLPGISGWAQVNGRNSISWDEKFKYDVWYVDNVNFILDVKILILTVLKVVKRADVNQSASNTMVSFVEYQENETGVKI